MVTTTCLATIYHWMLCDGWLLVTREFYDTASLAQFSAAARVVNDSRSRGPQKASNCVLAAEKIISQHSQFVGVWICGCVGVWVCG